MKSIIFNIQRLFRGLIKGLYASWYIPIIKKSGVTTYEMGIIINEPYRQGVGLYFDFKDRAIRFRFFNLEIRFEPYEDLPF